MWGHRDGAEERRGESHASAEDCMLHTVLDKYRGAEWLAGKIYLGSTSLSPSLPHVAHEPVGMWLENCLIPKFEIISQNHYNEPCFKPLPSFSLPPPATKSQLR